MCEADQAIKTFAQFVALLARGDDSVFEEIAYVPGNHDHHLWKVARETQYLNYMRRLERIEDLEAPWHTTKLFMNAKGKDRLPQGTLTEVSRKVAGLEHPEVLTAYPNFGILEQHGGQARCAIFHHGHFIESMYHMMSTLASLAFSDHEMPRRVSDLEAKNFAWIDFFWSTMGQSGKVGTDIERVYEASSDVASLQKLMDRLALSLARRYLLFCRWDSLEEGVLRWLFRHFVTSRIAGRQERQRGVNSRPLPLSEEAEKGLRWYLEGPLQNQIQTERGRVPDRVTFVSGHTHRPFEFLMDSQITPQPVRILNTGGWVVDTRTPRPWHGGAVALLDEHLNAVSVRLYSEGQPGVRVEEPLLPGERHSELWEYVNSVIQPPVEPWRTFTETIAREAQARVQFFGR